MNAGVTPRRDFRNGIVRVLRQTVRESDGAVVLETAGTGFVVHADGLIATCAHVVSFDANPPQTEVWIEFDTGERFPGHVVPQWWRPANRQDVSIIQLKDGLPRTVAPPSDEPGAPQRERKVIVLPTGDRLDGDAGLFQTFGFPDSKPEEGLPGDCRFMGATTENGSEVIAVESASGTYGFSGAPVWDPRRECVVGMIVSVVPPGKDPRGNQSRITFFTPARTLRQICDLLKFDPSCPYRGETAFSEDDIDLYFGRDAALTDLAAAIRIWDVVTIVGASGSGKSALLLTGLARWRRDTRDAGLENRRILRMIAGVHPYLALMAALQGSVGFDSDPETGIERPARFSIRSMENETKIIEFAPRTVADGVRSRVNRVPLVLVVDQFERLFTDQPPIPLRNHFCEFLAELASFDIKIVLGLRLAFRESAGQLPRLGPRLNEAEIVLRPLNENELRQAIEGPAEKRLRHFEPALVDRLVSEAVGRDGSLPLLQFALEDLWTQQAHTGIIGLQGYENLDGAIKRRAEKVWQSLDQTRIAAAERVLLNLCAGFQSQYGQVALDDVTYVSRRAWQSEWNEEVHATANLLTDTFLVTQTLDPRSKEAVYEIAHETILNSWLRLRVLIQKNQAYVDWYANELMPRMRSWIEHGRAEDFVMPLEFAERGEQYRRANHSLVSGPPAAYIRATLRKYSRDRLKRRLLLASVPVLGVLVYTLWTIRDRADHFLGDALQEKAIQAIAGHDPVSAQILLARSLQLEDNPVVRTQLLSATAASPHFIGKIVSGRGVFALQPDRRLALLRDRPDVADLVDDSGRVLQSFRSDDGSAFVRAALGPRGSLIAMTTGGSSKKLTIFEKAVEPSWAKAAELNLPSPAMRIAISQDETMIAGGLEDGTVAVWTRQPADGNWRSAPVLILGEKSGIAQDTVSISPQADRIVAGDAAGAIRMWSILLSPSPRALGAPVLFGGNALSSIQAGPKQGAGFQPVESVESSSFAPSGAVVATGGADNLIRIWSAVNGRQLLRFPAEGIVKSLHFTSDGRMLVAGGDSDVIQVIDLIAQRESLRIHTYLPDTSDTGLSADGLLMAGSNVDGKSSNANGLMIWRTNDLPYWGQLNDPDGSVVSLSWTRDGRLMSSGHGLPPKIWDLRQGSFQYLQIPIGHPRVDGGVWAVDCSAAHDWCVSAGHDHWLRQWDTESGKLIRDYDVGQESWTVRINRADQILVGTDKRVLAAAEAAKLCGHVPMGLDTTQVAYIRLIAGGDVIHSWTHCGGSVYNLDFAPDQERFASSGGDGTVRLWDLRGDSPRFLSNPAVDHETFGLGFNPNGSLLAAGGGDHTLHLWSLDDSEAVARPDPGTHDGAIVSLSWRNNLEMATAGMDGAVYFWDIGTPGRKILMDKHEQPFWWVTFSRDGSRLAAGNLDGSIEVWAVDTVLNRLEHISPDAWYAESSERTGLGVDVEDSTRAGVRVLPLTQMPRSRPSVTLRLKQLLLHRR